MFTFWCEWDVGILDPFWETKEQMINDLREKHEYLFDGDPDYSDFDQCVEEGLYKFKEVQ